MAKVKIQGHASGTGVLTVTAPNTSTDRTITLPDSTDTLAVNSDVTNKLPLAGGTLTGTLNVTNELPSIKLTDTNSGGYYSSVNQEGSSFKILADEGNVGSGQIRFYVGSGAEKVRILSSGGITFNGDTAAANALDDYEEGTCTIQYSDGTTSVGSANTSKYTKVGRQVTVTGYINVVNIDALTDSSSIRLAGFPFTATSDTAFSFFSRFLNAPTNTINMVGYLPNNNTYAQLYAMVDNAAYHNVICGEISNNNDLYFGVTYTAA